MSLNKTLWTNEHLLNGPPVFPEPAMLLFQHALLQHLVVQFLHEGIKVKQVAIPSCTGAQGTAVVGVHVEYKNNS